jgi:divalent metal cation (Fe/Co/Zn/Cd) transporter
MKKLKLILKKGETALKYSSLINLLLAIVKGIVGFLSGSIALIANSIHSFFGYSRISGSIHWT